MPHTPAKAHADWNTPLCECRSLLTPIAMYLASLGHLGISVCEILPVLLEPLLNLYPLSLRSRCFIILRRSNLPRLFAFQVVHCGAQRGQ